MAENFEVHAWEDAEIKIQYNLGTWPYSLNLLLSHSLTPPFHSFLYPPQKTPYLRDDLRQVKTRGKKAKAEDKAKEETKAKEGVKAKVV